jgi:hypothetical protein
MNEEAETVESEVSKRRKTTGRTNVAAVVACYQLLLWLIPVLDALPRKKKLQLGDKVVNHGVGRFG